jgi:hypothetical protein
MGYHGLFIFWCPPWRAAPYHTNARLKQKVNNPNLKLHLTILCYILLYYNDITLYIT